MIFHIPIDPIFLFRPFSICHLLSFCLDNIQNELIGYLNSILLNISHFPSTIIVQLSTYCYPYSIDLLMVLALSVPYYSSINKIILNDSSVTSIFLNSVYFYPFPIWCILLLSTNIFNFYLTLPDICDSCSLLFLSLL